MKGKSKQQTYVALQDIAPYFPDQISNPHAKTFLLKQLDKLNMIVEKVQKTWRHCTPLSLFYGFKLVSYDIDTFLRLVQIDPIFIRDADEGAEDLMQAQNQYSGTQSENKKEEENEEEEEEEEEEDVFFETPIPDVTKLADEHSWTDEETAILQALNSCGAYISELVNYFGRSKESITLRLQKLNMAPIEKGEKNPKPSKIKKPQTDSLREWEPPEIEILTSEHQKGTSAQEIAALLGRTIGSVQTRINQQYPKYHQKDTKSLISHSTTNRTTPKKKPVKSQTKIMPLPHDDHDWSQVELKVLLNEFEHGKTPTEIGSLLHRSLDSVEGQLKRFQEKGKIKKSDLTKALSQKKLETQQSPLKFEAMKIPKQPKKADHHKHRKESDWTEAELQTLLQEAKRGKNRDEIAAILNKTRGTVAAQLNKIGLKDSEYGSSFFWSQEEKDIVKREYNKGKSNIEIAQLLNRVPSSIKGAVLQLRTAGIIKPRKPNRKWTPEDEARLSKEVSIGTPIKQIAAILGRSTTSTQTKMMWQSAKLMKAQ